jgi:hypothetical protein
MIMAAMIDQLLALLLLSLIAVAIAGDAYAVMTWARRWRGP